MGKKESRIKQVSTAFVCVPYSELCQNRAESVSPSGLVYVLDPVFYVFKISQPTLNLEN